MPFLPKGYASTCISIIVFDMISWLVGGGGVMLLSQYLAYPEETNAGKTFNESLHWHLWFADQADVDSFVKLSQRQKSEKRCGFEG